MVKKYENASKELSTDYISSGHDSFSESEFSSAEIECFEQIASIIEESLADMTTIDISNKVYHML